MAEDLMGVAVLIVVSAPMLVVGFAMVADYRGTAGWFAGLGMRGPNKIFGTSQRRFRQQYSNVRVFGVMMSAAGASALITAVKVALDA